MAPKTQTQNSSFWKHLVDEAAVGVYVTSVKGGILYANQTLADILGVDSPEKLKKMKASSFYQNPKDREAFLKLLKKQKTVRNYELNFVTAKGKKIVIELSAKLIGDELHGVIVDYTDRKHAEEKYRLLADNISDVLWVLRLPPVAQLLKKIPSKALAQKIAKHFSVLDFDYISPSVQRLYGYTPNEFSRLGMKDIMVPGSYEITMQTLVEEILRDNQKRVPKDRYRIMELEQFHKNGSRLHVEIKVNFLRDEFGNPIGIIGVTRDITERREAAAKLERFAQVINQAKEMIVITDAEAHIQFVNPSFIKVYGYKPEEIIGKTPAILKSGKFSKDFYKNLWKKLKAKQPVKQEFINKTKNGSLITVLNHISPILDDKKRLTGFLTIQSDITEEQQIKKKLQETEVKYRDIVENAPIMIHSVSPDGKIIFANRRESDILGYSNKELLGMDICKLYGKDLCMTVKNSLKSIEDMGRKFIPYGTMLKKNGEEIIVEIDSIAVYDEAGNFQHTRSIIRDITERHQIEKELKEKVSQMEFMARLNLKRYKKMLEQQKEIIRLKKRLGETPPTLEEIRDLFDFSD